LVVVAVVTAACGGAERKRIPDGYVWQGRRIDVPPPPPPPADVQQGPGHASLEALVPFQQWPQVPARVRGIVYVAGPQPWGGAINHMRGIEASPDRREYKFSFDRSSPYAIYFESDGRGYNYLHGWQVPTPTGPMHINSAMFLQDTPNTWGMNRRAHLVEIDVNHGRGGVGGHVHFVGTSVRVLDGSASHPMRVEDVLLQLTARFQQERGQRSTGIWPTWIESEGVLEVLFYAGSVASMYRVARDGRVISETRYP
jgi:hypothetical protein